MTSIVIPADYCVALIDAGAYPSFLDLNWTLEQIKQHFVSQMNQGTMLAWGTGASANWHIETVAASEVSRGFREFTGRITATSDRLYLVSYEDLTAAAQYEDELLP